uniref:Glycosyltransferase AglE n=1 Tax=Candidatus Methanogaster sp. ANME-2c ERB4 TaxID=2759911 RepID=A0A7G9Y442_9EURY|nr:glycosyltransferase AglE [Methanosarcinales archaeon ANME-2c ERB4]QNO42776.1 glycosyltransferase AglE [Methanosarcinales archaeon ANME-2c ERB4]
MSGLPTVSVIVPAYNAEKTIKECVESLLNQDFPKDRYEILVVDNNSNDRTKEIVKEYPVKLLEEKKIQSSYAARNKGIQNAKNKILVFIDSDCIATPQWVKEGINVLVSESADLVGGEVEFFYSKNKSAAELYDSITNMQIESNIKEGNIAKTANLFVKSFLFGKIGMFPDWVKSGGDVQWTSKATKNGYSLVYAPKAVVKHPARPLKALLKKLYRVGGGNTHIWIGEGRSLLKITYSAFRSILPPRLSSIKKMIYHRGTSEMNKKVLSIWGVSYLCTLSMGLGTLITLIKVLVRNYDRDTI